MADFFKNPSVCQQINLYCCFQVRGWGEKENWSGEWIYCHQKGTFADSWSIVVLFCKQFLHFMPSGHPLLMHTCVFNVCVIGGRWRTVGFSRSGSGAGRPGGEAGLPKGWLWWGNDEIYCILSSFFVCFSHLTLLCSHLLPEGDQRDAVACPERDSGDTWQQQTVAGHGRDHWECQEAVCRHGHSY